ncbi:MAG: hypothetical protein Q4B88_01875 [Moraxella sp.]|nr:hypothetical protein [Moraxella sp.]
MRFFECHKTWLVVVFFVDEVAVMPILEFGGMIFEWHDPKYELVLNKRNLFI